MIEDKFQKKEENKYILKNSILKFLMISCCNFQLAIEYGIKFMETSAKASVNVEEAFTTLARDIKAKTEKKLVSNLIVFCFSFFSIHFKQFYLFFLAKHQHLNFSYFLHFQKVISFIKNIFF